MPLRIRILADGRAPVVVDQAMLRWGSLLIKMTDPPSVRELLDVEIETPEGPRWKLPGEVVHVIPALDGKGPATVGIALEADDDVESEIDEQMTRLRWVGEEGEEQRPEAPAEEPESPSTGLWGASTGPWHDPSAAPIVGIDFGTSYSRVAALRDGEIQFLADDSGRTSIPSVVWVNGDGEPVVGAPAERRLVTDPQSAVPAVKRILGCAIDDDAAVPLLASLTCPGRAGPDREIELLLGGKAFDPESIAAFILRHLKEVAEVELGAPVGKVILAYPAVFGGRQRAALSRAARRAELEVVAFVPEPTAAALAHGLDGAPGAVGVYDLGGGAFDFCVLGPMGRALHIESAAGDASLGGLDVTWALAGAIADRFQADSGIDLREKSLEWSRLVLASEILKRRLGDVESIEVKMPGATPETDGKHRVVVTRQLRDALASKISDRTIALCGQALVAGNLGPGDLSRVLVGGGATRLAPVRDAVRAFFGPEASFAEDPDRAVVAGAAVLGARLVGRSEEEVQAAIDGMGRLAARPSLVSDEQDELATNLLKVQAISDEEGAPVLLPAPRAPEEVDDQDDVATFDFVRGDDDSGLAGPLEEDDGKPEPAEPPQDNEVISVDESLDEGGNPWVATTTQTQQQRALKTPCTLGRYELLAPLGFGGMAGIYLARLPGPAGFQKPLAVKVLYRHLAGDSDFARMFMTEASIASQLQHPNVVQIFEVGEGGSFIAMECLLGETVRTVMRRLVDDETKMIDPRVACHIVGQAAEGLHYAHELSSLEGRPLGLVHRDVSPQNLVVTYSGSVKLLDFGVAKAAVGSHHSTVTGDLKGKVAYMAPEQVWGESADRRSDVFSLGVVLWEMLTRRRLFKGDNHADTLRNVSKAVVPDLRTFRRELPAPVNDVAQKALARDPAERYQTAQELLEELGDLGAHLGSPLSTHDLAARMEQRFGETRRRKLAFVARLMRASADELAATTVEGNAEDPTPSESSLPLRGSVPAGPATPPPSTPAPTRAQGPGRVDRTTLILAVAIIFAAVGTALLASQLITTRRAQRGEAIPAALSPGAPTAAGAAEGAAPSRDNDLELYRTAGGAGAATADTSPEPGGADVDAGGTVVAPTEEEHVTLRLVVSPRRAEVYVDGAHQPDPLRIELARSGEPAQVRITADGLTEARFEVVPDRDQRRRVRLRRDGPALVN